MSKKVPATEYHEFECPKCNTKLKIALKPEYYGKQIKGSCPECSNVALLTIDMPLSALIEKATKNVERIAKGAVKKAHPHVKALEVAMAEYVKERKAS